MMVIFTSQSDKNALKTTRWILDAFANRIGTDTWQTVITEDGLQMVKRLLRRHATKSMSVSCRWIRSRTRSQLLWIVGDSSRFDENGYVPVNSTQKDIAHQAWENDWIYLPEIKSLAAMAGVLHDWGKSETAFQKMLKKASNGKRESDEVYRHEWLSCKLLEGLVWQTEKRTDEEWLKILQSGKIPEKKLEEWLAENASEKLKELPPVASMLCWLILSHHRLPVLDKADAKAYANDEATSFSRLLSGLDAVWGYQKQGKAAVKLSRGLLKSDKWQKQVKKWSDRLAAQIPVLHELWAQENIRLLLLYARVSLMLSDYTVSAAKAESSWPQDCALFANTDKHGLKQRLDEHLVRVSMQAAQAAHCLPHFIHGMDRIEDVPNLRRKSPPAFVWQDKSVAKIGDWRKAKEKAGRSHEGWFVINMAGTGCGKTMGNAKIMQALSEDGKSLRYSLLLGLRSLTLQTGREYQKRIGLDVGEIAVLVGSAAAKELYGEGAWEESADTDCMNGLLAGEVKADFAVNDKMLAVLFASSAQLAQKHKELLYAPVLAATIDHLMPATETVRGGRYILPFLRMMSADVVIDEIDDFAGADLVAIARLVHMAGMLGRNVILSSATIPPDLAEGLFSAYWSGRKLYTRFFKYPLRVNCVWCDEFQTKIQLMESPELAKVLPAYRQWHKNFALRHKEKLSQQPVKRRGWIVECTDLFALPLADRQNAYCKLMQDAMLKLHQQYAVTDKRTGKQVSFGVVRLANIRPCVETAKFLLAAEWPEEFAPRLLVYHSRQTALLRSQEERYLDVVLKRKKQDATEIDFQDIVVRRQIDHTDAQNVVFILVATPVEELGRDHDFDWAVVEPSSYRSIIQLAGRIRRHRLALENGEIGNIAIMQYNLKAITSGDKVVFCRPGFESRKYALETHDMKALVDTEELAKGINAVPRTVRPEKLSPHKKLIHLEHQVLTDFRDLSCFGPSRLHGWQEESWWLTGLPQQFNKFREGAQDIELCLKKQENGTFCFCEQSESTDEWIEREDWYHIQKQKDEESERFWLQRDYQQALADYQGDSANSKGVIQAGILHLPANREKTVWVYSDQFGMYDEKKDFAP
ncbi:CRISPR-associated endonuclease/helicase Cas3 [Selenomonas ruminantium]|uniref:CRISPR-associated endonuclease/helicase Cas3 n=1 Tax=Selenomonas ruminantium TaxID=971 RepID=A0A1M6W5M5_SELRU|nr:type I-F CRISPR-associated helicase Cas3f [Selenomonas ruminantium]SHK88806.1 CRISPR-associated endonuclease/helicase Cas3 [Selenomonas ruminantium]